ncbi:IclR family transcriptional regulator [Bradyrhizobium iriomotense]|uniref:Transcriptional regulator n=1 Tax=Bradyrhizobium iriomotense TaxID=441950 RepID=A0ABQ6ASH6_9BRAD|nr:IclR family transcriptional regulator [Bradyrhizobium iriomotense]GLR85109.1 transcriptional regulator [Bradyrhizobium iriomotense]
MIVRQAANVLEIMEYFAQAKKPATLAEIADHFGWPRSSTFNLLATLSEKGYLYEPRRRGGYYPTPRWLTLARMVSEVEPLPPWVHALISELSAETGETASIVAPSGVMAVFIDVVESQAPIRYFATIGHRIPIHASASGRALLLQYSKEERDQLYRKIEFRPYGASTPISIEAVEAELRNSIARGYCQSFGDYSRDLAGAAIPLPIGDRRLSVVVAGPEFRIGPKVPDVAALIARTIDRLRPKTAA